MLQELDISLSDSTAKTVRASIYKIAFKTIPRCGVAALMLLCMGLYFLFPACQTFQQIQAEKNTPYELTATTDNNSIDLNTLMQIEGVERISPVVNLNATLSLNEYKLDCKIKAVYSSFHSLKFIQGTVYPDSSNMPYLILNEAATKAFAHEYQTITVTLDDTVMMSVNGTGRKAIVCGIFDDESEVPTIYMSYDVAQKEYGSSVQTELVFLLNNMGAAENVVSALQRQNIYASFDPNLTLAWELLQKQGWQTILLSIGLLACAAALIREKRSAEIAKAHTETAMLLLSGMTADAIERIYPLQIALTGAICTLVATLIALIMGTFSLISVGISICVAGVEFAITLYRNASQIGTHFVCWDITLLTQWGQRFRPCGLYLHRILWTDRIPSHNLCPVPPSSRGRISPASDTGSRTSPGSSFPPQFLRYLD